MDALFQIGVAITSESTVEQVLQSILDECKRVLPVDTLYVALYDEESDSYEIPIFYDVGQYRSIERRECKAVRSLTCEVIAQRSALYIPDTHDLGAMSSHIAVYVAQAPTRTYLGVPMIFRERVIGVLSIQSLQVDAYDPSVLQLLQTVAMQAAVAVENARLYEAAQREIVTVAAHETRQHHHRVAVTLRRHLVQSAAAELQGHQFHYCPMGFGERQQRTGGWAAGPVGGDAGRPGLHLRGRCLHHGATFHKQTPWQSIAKISYPEKCGDGGRRRAFARFN